MKVAAVGAGVLHTAFVIAGRLYLCGAGMHGMLGTGDPTHGHAHVPTPSASPVGLAQPHRVVAVTCGDQHTLALLEAPAGAIGESSDGVSAMQCAVLSWGCGQGGRLGHGGERDETSPRTLRAAAFRHDDPGGRVVRAAAGGSHSLLLTADGEVLAFGCSSDGRLGLGLGHGIDAGAGTGAGAGCEGVCCDRPAVVHLRNARLCVCEPPPPEAAALGLVLGSGLGVAIGLGAAALQDAAALVV